MKLKLGQGAYTITEVMIFLAVSGFMLTVILISYSGEQNKTQFNQAVKDFESRLVDLANDVSNGFYSSSNNFTCTSSPSAVGVTLSGGSNARGTNDGCIFAGQAIIFNVGTGEYTITPLAGKQQTLTGGEVKEVVSIDQANPSPVTFSELDENINYQYRVAKITSNNGATSNITGFAFMTTFGSYGPADLNSGDIHTDLLPLTGGIPNNAASWNTAYSNINPSGGITVCLQNGSGSSSRHGSIVLGGSGRRLTTSIDIAPGACP